MFKAVPTFDTAFSVLLYITRTKYKHQHMYIHMHTAGTTAHPWKPKCTRLEPTAHPWKTKLHTAGTNCTPQVHKKSAHPPCAKILLYQRRKLHFMKANFRHSDRSNNRFEMCVHRMIMKRFAYLICENKMLRIMISTARFEYVSLLLYLNSF